MIVSHRHKFIFIKNRKIAGSAIERYLASFCGPEDIITPHPTPKPEATNYNTSYSPMPELVGTINPIQHARTIRDWRRRWTFFSHLGAYSARHRLGRILWDQYFKFTFERHPWDKMVSFYFFRTRKLDVRPSFEEYLNTRELSMDRKYPTDWARYAIRNKVAVDYIGMYHNVLNDFQDICKRLELPVPEALPSNNVGVSRSGRDYRDFYDERTDRLVRRVFRREIEYFGFDFENSASGRAARP